MISKSELLTDFKRIGIKEGDVLMLHVSVKQIGWLEEGPEMIIRTLKEILGESGTIMMYCGWEESPYRMENWSEAKKAEFLKSNIAFDPKVSMSVKSWGILVEVLRNWPGGVRSGHPDGSFTALGKHANYLTSGHSLKYGYGKESPLNKFIELRGKIVNIGAPLNTTTLLHHSEDRANVRNKKVVKYLMPILGRENQRDWVEVEEYDTSKGIVDWYSGDYFEDLMSNYIEENRIERHKIGRGVGVLFLSEELNKYAITWMENKLNR